MTISVNDLEITAHAKGDKECPAGAIYFYRPLNFGGLTHRKDLEALYRRNVNPTVADVWERGKTLDKKTKKRSHKKSQKKTVSARAGAVRR